MVHEPFTPPPFSFNVFLSNHGRVLSTSALGNARRWCHRPRGQVLLPSPPRGEGRTRHRPGSLPSAGGLDRPTSTFAVIRQICSAVERMGNFPAAPLFGKPFPP